MNEEKKIAKTILNAQKLHEESYVPAPETPDTYNDDGSLKIRTDFGSYSKDIETCLIEAGKEQGLSVNLWYLLSLAVHWMNDATAWAEDVLADRNIYELLNDGNENSDTTPAYLWKCSTCGLESNDPSVPAGHVCHSGTYEKDTDLGDKQSDKDIDNVIENLDELIAEVKEEVKADKANPQNQN